MKQSDLGKSLDPTVQSSDTRPPLDQIQLIHGIIRQQRRTGEICMQDCGYPTGLHIKEHAQCNGTGPYNQIQLIHGERYMKTLVTLHMGGKRLTRFVGV